jgi:hypothetical protein
MNKVNFPQSSPRSNNPPIVVLFLLQLLRREVELRRPRLAQLKAINRHVRTILVAQRQCREGRK